MANDQDDRHIVRPLFTEDDMFIEVIEDEADGAQIKISQDFPDFFGWLMTCWAVERGILPIVYTLEEDLRPHIKMDARTMTYVVVFGQREFTPPLPLLEVNLLDRDQNILRTYYSDDGGKTIRFPMNDVLVVYPVDDIQLVMANVVNIPSVTETPQISQLLKKYRPKLDVAAPIAVDINDDGDIVLETTLPEFVSWEEDCRLAATGVFTPRYLDPDNHLPFLMREEGRIVLIAGSREMIPAYPLVRLVLRDQDNFILDEFETTDGGKTIRYDETIFQSSEEDVDLIELVMTEEVEDTHNKVDTST